MSPFREILPSQAKLLALSKVQEAVVTFVEDRPQPLTCHWIDRGKGRTKRSTPCFGDDCCRRYGAPERHAAIAALLHLAEAPAPRQAEALPWVRTPPIVLEFRARFTPEQRERYIASVIQRNPGIASARAIAEELAAREICRRHEAPAAQPAAQPLERRAEPAGIERIVHVVIDLPRGSIPEFERQMEKHRLADQPWRGTKWQLLPRFVGTEFRVNPTLLGSAGDVPAPVESGMEFFCRIWGISLEAVSAGGAP